ncbi:MAG: hypothetical protein ACQER1_00390 [Armatimonadota bacterium]
MKALIWREMRRLRTPMLIAAGALLVTVSVDLVWLGDRGHGAYRIADFWTLVTPLLALAAGASLGAAERGSRETQFASAWPVSRGGIWRARVLAGLILVVALCVASAIATVAAGRGPQAFFSPVGVHERPMALASTAACLLSLSVGMMVGGFAASPFGATVLGAVLLGLAGGGSVLLLEIPVADAFGPRLGIHIARPSGVAVTLLMWLGLALSAAALGASWLASRKGAALETGLRRAVTLVTWPVLTAVAFALVVAGCFPFGRVTEDDVRFLVWARPLDDGRIVFLEGSPKPIFDSVREIHMARAWMLEPESRDLSLVARWPCNYIGRGAGASTLLVGWRESSIWLRDGPEGPWLANREADIETAYAWRHRSPDGRWLYDRPELIELSGALAARELPRPKPSQVECWHVSGDAAFLRGKTSGEDEGREAFWRQEIPGGSVAVYAAGPAWANYGSTINPDGSVVVWVGTMQREMESAVGSGMPSGPDRPMPQAPGMGFGPDGMDVQTEVVRVTDGESLLVEQAAPMGRPWSGGGRYLWLHGANRIVVADTEKMVVANEIAVREAGSTELSEWVAEQGDADQNSPDGTRRVFWTAFSRTGPFGSTRLRMWLANADGSGVRQVLKQPWNEGLKMCGWIDDGHVLLIRDGRWLGSLDVEARTEELLYETPMQWEDWPGWQP